MNNIDERIEKAMTQVDLRKPETFQEAANIILTEDAYVKAGETVAIIDDPTYPYSGQKAKVVGPADKGEGWVNVRFDNGTEFPVQSSLLLKL